MVLASFEQFCGSVFWNDSLTWDTGNESLPDFSVCFQHTVAVWVPCFFLWLALPGYLIYLKNSKNGTYQNISSLSAAKSLISVALAAVAIYQLVWLLTRPSSSKSAVAAYLSAVLNAASMLLAANLVQYYRLKGLFTSGVLWTYWALWVVGAAVPLYSYCLHAYYDGVIADVSNFSVTLITFSLVLVGFLLACISDADDNTLDAFKDICPEHTSSFLSYVTYSWVTPVLVSGYKKTLERSDLWRLGPRDQAKNHVPAFERDWKEAVAQWRLRATSAETNVCCELPNTESINDAQDETTPLIRKPKRTSQAKLSLLSVIFKHYRVTLLTAWSLSFLLIALRFLDPMIMKQLIQFVDSRSSSNEEPVWRGYALSVFFLLNGLLQTVLSQIVWYLGVQSEIHCMNALVAVIFKKALTMGYQARQTSTVGEITNHMSDDADRVSSALCWMWLGLSCPVQIIIALWQLYALVGASMFAGLGVLLLSIPLNSWISVKQRNISLSKMKLKDQRIKLMNEIISGIKVIKLYAWEPSFTDKVTAIRDKEMEFMRWIWYYRAIHTFLFGSLPFVVTIVTFAVFIYTGPEQSLTSSTAFVSLSLFGLLGDPLQLLPIVIPWLAAAHAAVTRLVEFFKTADLKGDNVEYDDTAEKSLTIKDGTFSWLSTLPPILRNVNLEVPTGSLTSVVGTVGVGKSSLLAACVGDMEKLNGKVIVKGSVAFVAQQAWIQNLTVKDNILFGHPYDEQKYNKVIEACALRADLDILHKGDLTLIGEKGINLSGGQKQRVSLARAVYADADVYFLDDPLSAVDAHVGKHIFDYVIGPSGLLKDKTRVLVTHGIHWLPMVDNIVVLMNGTVSEVGSYDQLLSHDGPFAQFLKTYFLSDEHDFPDDDALGEELTNIKKAILERLESVDSTHASPAELISGNTANNILKRESSKTGSEKIPDASLIDDDDGEDDDEALETGRVEWSVYQSYIKASGGIPTILTVVSMFLVLAANIWSSIWLSIWTSDPTLSPTSNASSVYRQYETNKYLGIYGALIFLQTLFSLSGSVALAHCTVKASTIIHQKLLGNIMKVPMLFFDTKPLGRILNRFSKDTATLDSEVGGSIYGYIKTILDVVAAGIVIAYSTPIFLLVIAPVVLIVFFIQRFFIPTYRQLRRMESVAESPLYTHFTETINGAQTIRAFQDQERFQNKSQQLVEELMLYGYYRFMVDSWLYIRGTGTASFLVFFTALFCVISTQIEFLSDRMTGSIVGLALTYIINAMGSLHSIVMMRSSMEASIVAVERIKEYSEAGTEASWESDHLAPHLNWPSKGCIRFSKYATRYRPDHDLVLKDLDVDIKAGEKVGIVGRTGAGKSSLTLSIFRMIEAVSGAIHIDGIDIGQIGLHQLRNKITILPQEPVLFSGTIRGNLDPFNRFPDNVIWEVLQQSDLKEYIMNLPDKLNHDVGEGGQNLSVGQRQLLCLSRALLRKTKILVLDEATAAVDLGTDSVIQTTIRTAFADCTVLTIAHRINTILDTDRVLVLDRGQVAEFDSPNRLLEDEGSVFYGMARAAGVVTQDVIAQS